MPAVLRVHPHRGDQVAAGVVLLTLFIVLVNLRMVATGPWSDVVGLIISGAAALLVVGMCVQPGSGDDVPRAYESVLQVSAFLLELMTLINLADVFGSNGGSGTFVWVGLLLIAFCLYFARGRNSAIMTLLAAVTGVVVFLAFVDLISSPGVNTIKWLLLLSAAVLSLAAVAQRDARRRHAVSLVDAAGLTVIVLGVVVIAEQVVSLLGSVIGGAFNGDNVALTGGPDGWELVLLAFGIGLIAYGSVDRERVPPFLGIIVLVLYMVEAFQPGEDGPSLVGWPIILLVLAGLMLVVGLRPRQDLPPEPPVPPATPSGNPPPTAPTAVAEP
jgi:hypothetical protein